MLTNPISRYEPVEKIEIERELTLVCDGEFIRFLFSNGTPEPHVDAGSEFRILPDNGMELYQDAEKYILFHPAEQWQVECPKEHSSIE